MRRDDRRGILRNARQRRPYPDCNARLDGATRQRRIRLLGCLDALAATHKEGERVPSCYVRDLNASGAAFRNFVVSRQESLSQAVF